MIDFDKPDSEGQCPNCGSQDEDLWYLFGMYKCWDCAVIEEEKWGESKS